jgi:hypothetical protein
MVNFPGRNARRRRVLKEEVLSAPNSAAALLKFSNSNPTSGAPRYSDAAAVENHPQVTDFVPRRYGTIAMLLALGAASVGGLCALDYFAPTIAQALGLSTVASIELASAGGLASWLAGAALLGAACTCVLIYSIRRHRIDDIRGRYRVWLAAAVAGVILSANSVAGFHQILADALGHVTGWTALRGGAIWWLLLAGLPLVWIAFRLLLDFRECRVATAFFVLAVACYAASLARFLGFGPTVGPRIDALLIGASLLVGHWVMLAAIVANARFVVLDAQGLVAVRSRSTKKVAPIKSTAPKRQAAAGPIGNVSASGPLRAMVQSAKTPAEPSKWIDGSRPVRDRFDDDEDDDASDEGHKLSKSDRKRLRKLKAQGRAA